MVDVVVGERMMKFQAMQLFIPEFYEILYFMRNSKFQFPLFTSIVIINFILVFSNYIA